MQFKVTIKANRDPKVRLMSIHPRFGKMQTLGGGVGSLGVVPRARSHRVWGLRPPEAESLLKAFHCINSNFCISWEVLWKHSIFYVIVMFTVKAGAYWCPQ